MPFRFLTEVIIKLMKKIMFYFMPKEQLGGNKMHQHLYPLIIKIQVMILFFIL